MCVGASEEICVQRRGDGEEGAIALRVEGRNQSHADTSALLQPPSLSHPFSSDRFVLLQCWHTRADKPPQGCRASPSTSSPIYASSSGDYHTQGRMEWKKTTGLRAGWAEGDRKTEGRIKASLAHIQPFSIWEMVCDWTISKPSANQMLSYYRWNINCIVLFAKVVWPNSKGCLHNIIFN